MKRTNKRLNEQRLNNIISRSIKRTINEMAVSKGRLAKGAEYLNQVVSEMQQLFSEYDNCLFDLTGGDENVVKVTKMPKMYKNGMVVFAIDGETYKCSFDSAKYNDQFGEIYSAQKMLKWLDKMVQWTKRHYEEYDPNWDGTSDEKGFMKALRGNKPFAPKGSMDESIRKAMKTVLSELDWKTYQSAAGKMYDKAREGFGQYEPSNEIPMDSEHGKMYKRAEDLQGMANKRFREDHGEPNYKTNPKGTEEYQHYVQGDYDYEPNGRGWHLKDGIDESVRKAMKKVLKEAMGLYTKDIDTSDLRVHVEPYNEDGYCEWEANCDNGWYTFCGTYAKGDCELMDVVEGHSGHGHFVTVNDELRDWFYDNLHDRIASEIERKQKDYYDL